MGILLYNMKIYSLLDLAYSDLIEAHLENVHDIQSGLSIISWWAGTSAGDSDVFTEEKTHSHTIQQRSLNTALSEGTTVYTTVKVCNKAGRMINIFHQKCEI